VPQFSPPAALSGSYEANSNVASEVGVGNSPRSAGAFPPDSFFGGSGNIEQGQAVGGAPQALQQSNEALGMGSETRNSGRCIPQCFYQCEDVRCDEVCEPICKPATCETRCQSVDLSSCTEDCSHPQCRIDCPYRQCPSAQCPFCQTKCGQPRCVLICPEQQPCNTVLSNLHAHGSAELHRLAQSPNVRCFASTRLDAWKHHISLCHLYKLERFVSRASLSAQNKLQT